MRFGQGMVRANQRRDQQQRAVTDGGAGITLERKKRFPRTHNQLNADI